MKFQIHECPLCNKVLQFKTAYGVSVYSCPDADHSGGNNKSHYEVESDGKQTIQHFYAFPFAVDNFSNKDRSRLYKWSGHRWSFVREVPFVPARSQQQIIDHLDKIQL